MIEKFSLPSSPFLSLGARGAGTPKSASERRPDRARRDAHPLALTAAHRFEPMGFRTRRRYFFSGIALALTSSR